MGEIIRQNAWLVEKRYVELARVDFNETFAVVAKLITITYIFAMGTTINWDIHQIDVKTTFLKIQAIAEGVVPPYLFVFIKKDFCRSQLDQSLYIKHTDKYLWWQFSTWTI